MRDERETLWFHAHLAVKVCQVHAHTALNQQLLLVVRFRQLQQVGALVEVVDVLHAHADALAQRRRHGRQIQRRKSIHCDDTMRG